MKPLLLPLLTLFASTTVLAAAPPAQTPDEPDARASEDKFGWVLGLRATYQPDYMGARESGAGLKPVVALQWGRWRLSSSGASAVMGFGRDIQGSGASTDLISKDRLRLSLSLRFDSGRKSSDSPRLEGLPDIRRTLRAQLTARYSLSKDSQLGLSWSADTLGRGGGSVLGLGLGHRLYHDGQLEYTAGGGLSWANGTYQRSNFGVAPEIAPNTHYRAYVPGSGLRDAYVGTGFTYAVTHHWIAYGSASLSRLLGPSADSPFVERRTAPQFAVGLAYRNK